MAKKPQGHMEENVTRKRLGGMGDSELAEALAVKVFAVLKPIQSRPRFKKIRAVLFGMFAELTEISQEPTSENE